jgi:hypothetical protein
MDILLNEDTHDAEFVNGDTPVTPTVDDGLKQRLKIKLLTFKGEWYLNTLYGTPYFQLIFGKGRGKAVVDSILRDTIREDEDVLRITRFDSSVSADRTYSLSFAVQSRTGATVEINDINVAI